MNATQETNWGAEAWRTPTLQEGDSMIYSEHGRVLNNTCYRSHWLALVKAQYGGYFLLVRHGGGEERTQVTWSDMIARALVNLDSDSRYFILYTMHHINTEARHAGVESVRVAHAEGRLKKSKVRGKSAIKVWIEPKTERAAA